MYIVINSKTKRKQHTGAYDKRSDAYIKMLELEHQDVYVYGNLQSYEIVEIDD